MINANSIPLPQNGKDLEFAGSVGKADQNAIGGPADRHPTGSLPKTDGPQRDPKTKKFAPAEYTRTRQIQGSNGQLVEVTTTRRDR